MTGSKPKCRHCLKPVMKEGNVHTHCKLMADEPNRPWLEDSMMPPTDWDANGGVPGTEWK